jgi:hypothetical protein
MSEQLLTVEVTVPEAVTEVNKYTVKMTEVRRADVVNGRVVDRVKSGPKWTELLDADGKRIARIESEFETYIERAEETGESRDARNRAYANRGIQRKLNDPATAVADAVAKIAEASAKGHEIGYNLLADLISAQAKAKVWASFRSAVLAAPDGLDLTEVRDAFRARLTDHLVGAVSGSQTGLSRSTSVVSNVLDDADRAAIADFIRDPWF